MPCYYQRNGLREVLGNHAVCPGPILQFSASWFACVLRDTYNRFDVDGAMDSVKAFMAAAMLLPLQFHRLSIYCHV